MCIKTSDTIGKVSGALIKAQKAIKVAVYDAQNPHFRSRYATLGAVVEACKGALNDNDLCFIQGSHLNPELPNMVCVTTRILHASGEYIEDTIAVPYAQATAQALGSSLTYGRRYGLASILGIVADEDDDGESAMPPKTSSANSRVVKSQPIQKKDDKETKRRKVVDLAVAEGCSQPADFERWFEAKLGRIVSKSTDLTEEEMDKILGK